MISCQKLLERSETPNSLVLLGHLCSLAQKSKLELQGRVLLMFGICMLYIGWNHVKEHVQTRNCQLCVVVIWRTFKSFVLELTLALLGTIELRDMINVWQSVLSVCVSGSVASFDYSGSEETWPWPRRNWETKKCQLTVTDRKYIIWKLEKVSSTYLSSEHKHGKDRPANDIVHPRVTQAKSKIGFVDLAALQKSPSPSFHFLSCPRPPRKLLDMLCSAVLCKTKAFLK